MEWNKPNKWTQEEVASFVQQYSDTLVRYAYCIVGDSAASEEIVLQAIATFVYRNADRALGKAYLYRIVRNRAIDYLRAHRRLVPLSDVEEVLSCGMQVEQRAMERERYATLYRCLSRLAVDYRHALYLQLEGFAVADMCRIMGKKTKQVYNLLARAKVALKEELIKEGFDYEDL